MAWEKEVRGEDWTFLNRWQRNKSSVSQKGISSQDTRKLTWKDIEGRHEGTNQEIEVWAGD